MSSQAPNGDGRPVVIAVNGAAVAAIVLGVVAIPVAFLPVIGVVLGGLLGLAGVATGIVGRRRAADDTDPKRQNMGLATGGIVASGIALVVVALQVVGIVTLTGLEVTEFTERVDGLGNLIPGVDIEATSEGIEVNETDG